MAEKVCGPLEGDCPGHRHLAAAGGNGSGCSAGTRARDRVQAALSPPGLSGQRVQERVPSLSGRSPGDPSRADDSWGALTGSFVMIWVRCGVCWVALSRAHEPAEPAGMEGFTGRGELVPDCRERCWLLRVADRPGANWGARSQRALALPGITCPAACDPPGPVTGVLHRRAVSGGGRGFWALTSRGDPMLQAVPETTAHAELRTCPTEGNQWPLPRHREMI